MGSLIINIARPENTVLVGSCLKKFAWRRVDVVKWADTPSWKITGMKMREVERIASECWDSLWPTAPSCVWQSPTLRNFVRNRKITLFAFLPDHARFLFSDSFVVSVTAFRFRQCSFLQRQLPCFQLLKPEHKKRKRTVEKNFNQVKIVFVWFMFGEKRVMAGKCSVFFITGLLRNCNQQHGCFAV